MQTVVDKNNQALQVGDRVVIHFERGTTSKGVIVRLCDSPTVLQPGFWVDVDRGDGPSGYPSYILEKQLDERYVLCHIQDKFGCLDREAKMVAWSAGDKNLALYIVQRCREGANMLWAWAPADFPIDPPQGEN